LANYLQNFFDPGTNKMPHLDLDALSRVDFAGHKNTEGSTIEASGFVERNIPSDQDLGLNGERFVHAHFLRKTNRTVTCYSPEGTGTLLRLVSV
jgi:hypothetical protein